MLISIDLIRYSTINFKMTVGEKTLSPRNPVHVCRRFLVLEMIFNGQRPVSVTLQAIGSKCGQINRGKLKM